MYACTADYEKLYTPSYFGKIAGATSFAPDPFTKEIVAFCSAKGLRFVVDIGSGSAALAAILRNYGIQVITCDFDPADADGIHFDLSGRQDSAADVLDLVRERTAGEPWLVTCLDVLEHVDIEHVFAAVRNLRVVCGTYLISSISTRPSSADNRYHATILPKPTWLAILRTAGFTVEAESIFASARSGRRDFPDTDNLKLVVHWAKCDPFRDIDFGEPDYVLLSAGSTAALLPDEEVRARVEAMLDISHRGAKRAQFGNAPIPRIGLNIHHTQEFVLLRPLLDVLPRSSVVALIRTPVLEPSALSLMRGFFARCGVQTITYERCTEIPWRELSLEFLITGGESNVSAEHIMSRQVVEASKLHGVHTMQMQHGIWIEQFSQRLVEFGSQTILSWSGGYEAFFRESEVSLAGKLVRAQLPRWQAFKRVGGAKFVDARLSSPQDLVRWRLGIDTTRYRAVALLGTNLLWHRHGGTAVSTRARLASLIRSVPDIFFVVKLHPAERVPDVPELVQPNALLLDDILLGVMDVHVSRLVAAVDVVISSLSTLLLDAAVAGTPCVQYETGNGLAYAGIAAIEIEQLPQVLQDVSAIPVNRELVETYAGAYDEPFYEHLSALLRTARPQVAETTGSASFYSVATEVEALWHGLRQASMNETAMRAELARTTSDTAALKLELETAHACVGAAERGRVSAEAQMASVLQSEEAAIAIAREELGETKMRLEAMRNSNSWRITAPIRRIREWISH